MWLYSRQSFLYRELQRFGIGSTAGAAITVLLRWFTGDSASASSVRQKLRGFSTPVLDLVFLYKPELIRLGVGITVIILIPLFSWLWKYAPQTVRSGRRPDAENVHQPMSLSSSGLSFVWHDCQPEGTKTDYAASILFEKQPDRFEVHSSRHYISNLTCIS